MTDTIRFDLSVSADVCWPRRPGISNLRTIPDQLEEWRAGPVLAYSLGQELGLVCPGSTPEMPEPSAFGPSAQRPMEMLHFNFNVRLGPMDSLFPQEQRFEKNKYLRRTMIIYNGMMPITPGRTFQKCQPIDRSPSAPLVAGQAPAS
jgi:hypothetical protein